MFKIGDVVKYTKRYDKRTEVVVERILMIEFSKLVGENLYHTASGKRKASQLVKVVK